MLTHLWIQFKHSNEFNMELTEDMGIVAEHIPFFSIFDVLVSHCSSNVKCHKMVQQLIGSFIVLVHVNAHAIENSNRVSSIGTWSCITFNHGDFRIVSGVFDLTVLESFKTYEIVKNIRHDDWNMFNGFWFEVDFS